MIQLKNFRTRELFFSAAVLVFLFLVGWASAITKCSSLETAPASFQCEIDYTDPGGAGLTKCQYQMVKQGNSPGTDYNNWPAAQGSCTGSGPVSLTAAITVTDGPGDYQLYWYAEDGAKNFKQDLLKTIKIISPPAVTTDAASNIQPTQATLNGTLNDLGGDSAANVWFEWGPTVSYGNKTVSQNRTVVGAFGTLISGLTPGATYHFQAVASNAAGTSYSLVGQQFTAPNPTFILKPASASIGVGTTQQFDGEYDSDGLAGSAASVVVSRTSVVWSSDNVSIASVNTSGLAAGLAAGSAVIKGIYSGIAAMAQLKVVSLTVSFSASPSLGAAPLNGVDLTANVGGTAIGPIDYKFDCTSDGTWDRTFDKITDNPKTAVNVCDYVSAGTYTSRVRVERDAALPVEATAKIVVGNLPDVKITSGPAKFTVDTTANFVFSSPSDPSAFFSCKLDGGSWESNCPSPRAYTVSPGAHTFSVKAKNDFGESPEAKWQWTVDTTAPEVNQFEADRTILNIANPKVTFSWQASDNSGGSGLKQIELWRRVKGESWPDSQLKTITLFGFTASGSFDDAPQDNGLYEYGVHLLDNAGKIGYEPATIFVLVDKTAPLIAIYTSSDRWHMGNPLLNVDFSDETGLDSGSYQIDSFGSGGWIDIFSNNSGLSFTNDFQILANLWNNLADGSSHTIYFKVADDAGNVVGADGNKSLLVKKDVSPPNTAVQCQSAVCSTDPYLASVQINLACSDSYSGCLITYYCQDQTNACIPNNIYSSTFSVTVGGQNYVRFYSRDKVQNQETIKSQAVKLVLNQPPAISAISHSPAAVSPLAVSWLGSAVKFSVGWSDPDALDQTKLHICKTEVISGQTCSGGSWCDTTSWSPTSPSSCSYTSQIADTTGTKNYYAFICDDDNACSDWKSGSFLVDAQKPKITYFNVSPKAPIWVNKNNPEVAISWTVTDSGGSHLWYANVYKDDGVNNRQLVATVNAPAVSPDGPWQGQVKDSPADGIWYYGVHVIDKAGNDTNEGDWGFSVAKVLVDKTSPNTQILSENPPGPWEKSPQFTIDTLDEDLESGGINNCGYKVFSYESNGAEHVYPSAGWASRTCDNPALPITVGSGAMCGYQSADSSDYNCYVYLKAFDLAGNEGQTNKGYQIDWTRPQPRKLYIAPSETSQSYPIGVKEGTAYVYKAQTPDNLKLAGCSLYVNNIDRGAMTLLPEGCSTNCSAQKAFTFTSSGAFNNNYVLCRDAAGNVFPETLVQRDGISVGIVVEANRAPTIVSGPSYTTSPCASPTTQPGCQVNFAVSATDADNDALNYAWTFGDSSTSNLQNSAYHYSSAGNYTAQVKISDGRGGTVSQSISVAVTNPTLSVNLTALPDSGVYPLNDVDLKAEVSGTMFGTINYKFDCANDRKWELETPPETLANYTAPDLCDYPTAGTYTAKVLVERGTGSDQDTTAVTVSANLPPQAGISGGSVAYTKSSFTLVNNSSDPNGGSDMKNSVWTIKEKSTGSVKDSSNCLAVSGNALCSWSLLSTFTSGVYIAELRVEDLSGAAGLVSKEFAVRQDILADFACSLDNKNWQKCDDKKFLPLKDEKVYFKDLSQKSEGSGSIISRVWQKDGLAFSSVNNPNPSLVIGGTKIKLIVADDENRSGFQEYDIQTQAAIPQWREISPF